MAVFPITLNLKIIMPKRHCAECGKDKEISGGRVCEKGHFICAYCVRGGFFDPTKTKCPICKTKLT